MTGFREQIADDRGQMRMDVGRLRIKVLEC